MESYSDFQAKVNNVKYPLFKYRPCMYCGDWDFKLKCQGNSYINICSMECSKWFAYTNFPFYPKPIEKNPLKKD